MASGTLCFATAFGIGNFRQNFRKNLLEVRPPPLSREAFPVIIREIARLVRIPSMFKVLAFCIASIVTSLAQASEVKTLTTPFIRANDALEQMRLDPKGHFLAYTPQGGTGLSVVDLKTKSIYKVSNVQVGASFFWSPDGYRLFYREHQRTRSGGLKSVLKAYDCYLSRTVTIEEMPYPTGILTFDPRDLRMHLMSAKGIRTKRIYFPDERLAKWQIAQRTESGKWLATQQGVLWVTQGGFRIQRMDDDGKGLDSFDLSPDGSTIAWATTGGKLYISKDGRKPRFIAYGRDPQWHPAKPILLFAGARMVGNTAVSYDVRVTDMDGHGKFVTATQGTDERWPQWHPKGTQILYTVAKTTDVFLMDFKY